MPYAASWRVWRVGRVERVERDKRVQRASKRVTNGKAWSAQIVMGKGRGKMGQDGAERWHGAVGISRTGGRGRPNVRVDLGSSPSVRS